MEKLSEVLASISGYLFTIFLIQLGISIAGVFSPGVILIAAAVLFIIAAIITV